MASRKPKGIVDDIVGGIRDIVSPWLGTPPGQNRQVTQAQGLARGAAETLDQVYAGGMIKAGTQGNKALAKQAAVNAAALGVGYVAGKAAVTAAGAVAKTGLPQRLANTLTGQKVVVVGTKSGYTTQVPTFPNVVNQHQTVYNKLKDTPVRWVWDPQTTTMSQKDFTKTATDYAKKYGQAFSRGKIVNEGQIGEIVVGTVPKKSLNYESVMPNWNTPDLKQYAAIQRIRAGDMSAVNDVAFKTGAAASTSPLKISGKVPTGFAKQYPGDPFGPYDKDLTQLVPELMKTIKRAGGKVPKRR